VNNAAQLFRLFGRPAEAMSAILDQGSPLFAASAVVIVSLLLELPLPIALSFSLAFLPLLALAVVYVPSTLLLTNLIERMGGLSVVFQRDYSPLLTCAAMAWSAISLPIVVAAWLLPLALVRGVAIVAYMYFAVLMVVAVRTVFWNGNAHCSGRRWLVMDSAVGRAVFVGAAQLCVAFSHLTTPPVIRFLLSS